MEPRGICIEIFEEKYAQIEKEALGIRAYITWACKRFSEYLVGMQFRVKMDHKPLVPLLDAKNLEELPARIQRFKMRFMRVTFTTHLGEISSLLIPCLEHLHTVLMWQMNNSVKT